MATSSAQGTTGQGQQEKIGFGQRPGTAGTNKQGGGQAQSQKAGAQ